MNRNAFFPGMMHNYEKTVSNSESNCNVNTPAVNIIEDEKQFSLELAAPGLKKEDFKINIENHLLTISKEVKEDK